MNLKTKRLLSRLAVGSSALGAASAASAADFSSITTAASFAGVDTAIINIAASLAGVYVIIKGSSIIVSMLRR